jgi:hypothetical protein
VDKIFVGISWKGSPAFGFTATWIDLNQMQVTLNLFGLDLFGFQFKKSKSKE